MTFEAQVRAKLDANELGALFRGVLGWDNASRASAVPLTADFGDGSAFNLVPIASKMHFVVYECEGFPSHQERQRIERFVARTQHDHLIIFRETSGRQHWQWAVQRPGRTSKLVHLTYSSGRGQALIERLQGLVIELDDQSGLTILGVRQRVAEAFRADRVTRDFYREFSERHTSLADSIQHIPTQDEREWYASILLNRLMFLYFMQRKQFLDSDLNYLRNRLERVQSMRGSGQFYTFYRHFLLPLFEEGLDSDLPISDPELAALVGSVPYLNGGIFGTHQLETAHPIDVPDESFESIFEFFDNWQWTLDDSEASDGDEINPDILGYIFEQYVNQKQMGAYYTKEDITRYICNATVLPLVISKVSAACEAEGVNFEPWALLAEDPERYFPPPALDFQAMPLSETPMSARRRVERVRALVDGARNGGVTDGESAVTVNVDLVQLIVDALLSADDVRVSLVTWGVLRTLTVLDPTCGSGAFLFAALDILEELYEAAWQRINEFREVGVITSTNYTDAMSICAEVDGHPSPQFFIIKQAILCNIYGVDIMPEAVEIAKLRLFLKLASLLQAGVHPDPLPDLDFNIVAGNALVGSVSETEAAVGGEKLDLGGHSAPVSQHADAARERYEAFRSIQVVGSAAEIREAKVALDESLRSLRGALDNRFLSQHGLKPADLKTYKPLHWYAEFHGAMTGGGFDCIVGNPPYVQLSDVDYELTGYEAEVCGDLYGCVMERAMNLLAEGGRLGFIIPVSIGSVEGFKPLRDLLLRQATAVHLLHFAERPAKLFTGAEKRLTIWLTDKAEGGVGAKVYSTGYRRWFAQERENLFATTQFAETTTAPHLVGSALPKVCTESEVSILWKLSEVRTDVSDYLVRSSEDLILYKRNFRYHAVFCDRPMETR